MVARVGARRSVASRTGSGLGTTTSSVGRLRPLVAIGGGLLGVLVYGAGFVVLTPLMTSAPAVYAVLSAIGGAVLLVGALTGFLASRRRTTAVVVPTVTLAAVLAGALSALLGWVAASSTGGEADPLGLVATLGLVGLCFWLGGVAVAMLVARSRRRDALRELR